VFLLVVKSAQIDYVEGLAVVGVIFIGSGFSAYDTKLRIQFLRLGPGTPFDLILCSILIQNSPDNNPAFVRSSVFLKGLGITNTTDILLAIAAISSAVTTF
jgi:hypothetical protein